MAALLTPASLPRSPIRLPAILTWAPVPGAVDLPRVRRDRRSRRRRRRARRHHLERRARLEQRRPADRRPRTRTSPSRRRCTRAPTTGRSCRSTPRATPARRRRSSRSPGSGPGTTTPTVTDMVPGVEIYDPLFQWAPIPGAASYQIEINPTSGFAHRLAGCTPPTPTATSFAPDADAAEQHLLLARPRRRSAGPGGSLEQRPVVRQDLRPDGRSRAPQPARSTTRSSQPIATGRQRQRAGRDVEHRARRARLRGEICTADGAPTIYFTANTAWTPLAHPPRASAEHLQRCRLGPRQGQPAAAAGTCDVSVRAYADNAIDGIGCRRATSRSRASSYGGEGFEPAHVRLPALDVRRPPHADADLVSTGRQPIVGKSPLLCWKPADMNSRVRASTPSTDYWVTIARDSNFTTIVEQAYTDEPC